MRKYKYFLDKSRKIRNKQWIGVNNRIREYGRDSLFYTDHYIDEGCDWLDFVFLGTKPRIFYNATLITPKYALHDIVYDVARENAEKLIPHTISFERVDNNYSRLVSSDKTTNLDKFDGLDRYEWCEVEAKRLVSQQEFSVNTHVKLSYDYAYGIGLNGIVDDNIITIDTINMFINSFIANGETEFIGKKHIATEEMINIHNIRIANAVTWGDDITSSEDDTNEI